MSEVTKSTTKGKLTIDKVSVSSFQKTGTKTLQLRQVITTHSSYPTTKVGNEFSDSLFRQETFGFAKKDFTSTANRVAFVNVPVNITNEQIKAKVIEANNQGGCIWRYMSNTPILSKDQEWSITKGYKTKDDYANSQVVRYPANHPKAGQIILDDNGLPQYKCTFFKSTPFDDVDERGKSEVYYSAEIKAELGSEVKEEVKTDWSLENKDNVPF